MTKELISAINKEFFKEFYDLDEAQLLLLNAYCEVYKVAWPELFYCPSLIQDVKLSIIAEKCCCIPSDLWEYKLIWMPSDDKDITVKALQKVQNDIDIMSILNQSKEFHIP